MGYVDPMVVSLKVLQARKCKIGVCIVRTTQAIGFQCFRVPWQLGKCSRRIQLVAAVIPMTPLSRQSWQHSWSQQVIGLTTCVAVGALQKLIGFLSTTCHWEPPLGTPPLGVTVFMSATLQRVQQSILTRTPTMVPFNGQLLFDSIRSAF